MKLHFDYRDLFRAPRLAFSAQRIWINWLGLGAAYLIYLIFTYLSLLVAGRPLAKIWAKFGLMPCTLAVHAPWFSTLIYLVGVALAIAVILLVNTAVCRAVYMTLRDEFFYTWRQAYRFAFKKWVSILGAILTFLFMIAFFVLGALFMGLLGRIPYLGELGNTLLVIPYLFAALLLIFIALAFGVGLVLLPAIMATSDEDAVGGVFQSFSTTFNQPWRLVLYGAIASVMEVVAFFVAALATKWAYLVFSGLFSVGMGRKFRVLSETALHMVNRSFPELRDWLELLFGRASEWIYFSHGHPALASGGYALFVAGLFALFLILMGGAVLAYAEATGNAGLTLLYIILYKKQEDENLLEREDEELKEEEEEEEKSGEAKADEEASQQSEAESEETKGQGEQDADSPSDQEDSEKKDQ